MPKKTINEAITEALKRENRPLRVGDIYKRISEDDLYRFNAANPEHIVRTQLRRHSENLDFPTANKKKHFLFLTDGTYWNKGTPIPNKKEIDSKTEIIIKKDSENLKSAIEDLKDIHKKHTIAFKQQILNQLQQIEPVSFEIFGRRLLEVYGFKKTVVTPYIKDGGLDGHGQLKVGITYLNVAFQCKRWKNNSVSRTEIDKFRGAIQGEFEQGIIFTTSKFTKEALGATRKPGAVPIILIDGNALIDIMIEKRFGVETDNIPIYLNALDNILNDI